VGDRLVSGAGGQLPAVTVVLPTHDRPAQLRRAVQAVLAQDYGGAVECLVVRDRSRVELPGDLVVATPTRSVRVMDNSRSPGLAGARNTGVCAAGGELVAFCDDDDEWLPTKLSAQVQALAAAPEHDVVSCGILTVNGGRVRARVLAQTEVTYAMFLRSRVMEVHSSTLLIRRRALLGGIGLVDEAVPGSYGEDYEWLLRASQRAPILVVPAPLVRIDLHPSSHFADQWSTMAKACHYLVQRHPGLRSDRTGLARIYGRLSIASAAQGQRRVACAYAARSLRLRARQHRAYVAVAISLRLLSADRAVRLANLLGHGI